MTPSTALRKSSTTDHCSVPSNEPCTMNNMGLEKFACFTSLTTPITVLFIMFIILAYLIKFTNIIMQIIFIKGTTLSCVALILYQINLTHQGHICTIPVALATNVLKMEYVITNCT